MKFQADDEHHEEESATGTRAEDRHQKAEIPYTREGKRPVDMSSCNLKGSL